MARGVRRTALNLTPLIGAILDSPRPAHRKTLKLGTAVTPDRVLEQPRIWFSEIALDLDRPTPPNPNARLRQQQPP